MTITNVNYASLVSDASMTASFIEQMQTAIATESGADVAPGDVQVLLTSGSVDVHAIITTPNRDTAQQLFTVLRGSTTLHQTITRSLLNVPQIH